MKMQRMYDIFFPNLGSIISEKWVVTPDFLFGYYTAFYVENKKIKI